MANQFIKPELVLGQMLGVLERDNVLINFVWRGVPDGAFKGAKNDTVTIKVPAYTTARTRTLRGGQPIVVDDLSQSKVDVRLTQHVYKAIGISDEELTLDIVDFGAEVTAPAMSSIVLKVDDNIGTLMDAATPEVEVSLNEDDPYLGLVDARTSLNLHSVPPSQRFLACGANVEAAILKSDRLSKFDQSGSSDALREAIIGRIAGFTAVSVPGLNPDLAMAAHRTAFVAALVAPEVPQGASWGERRTWKGMSLRTLRDYDPTGADGPQDRLLTDTFMGTAVTKDYGTIDEETHRFMPATEVDLDEDTPILVRAVSCRLGGS